MKSKFLISLSIAILMQCSVVFAESTGITPVYLNYKNTPKINGWNKPSKSPVRLQLSLNVSYDDVNKQLLFEDTEENSYTYAILDSSNSVVTEGILNFENLDIIPLNLDWAESGEYTLIIRFGDFEFSGSFEVE